MQGSVIGPDCGNRLKTQTHTVAGQFTVLCNDKCERVGDRIRSGGVAPRRVNAGVSGKSVLTVADLCKAPRRRLGQAEKLADLFGPVGRGGCLNARPQTH